MYKLKLMYIKLHFSLCINTQLCIIFYFKFTRCGIIAYFLNNWEWYSVGLNALISNLNKNSSIVALDI